MIGKIIGAFAGSQAARHTSKIGGTGGALLGAAVIPVVRRMKIPALLALVAGGYAVKKLSEKGAATSKTPSGTPLA